MLTKRQEMSLLMWAHGEQALAKSLVACKLYKAMAHEAAEDDLDTEIYDELKNFAKDFEAKGIKLLDFCYRQDAERAQRLLTCELQSWSNQSCLSLAVAANHRPLLAHPCSQIILADLWMGGLRTRKNTNLKVRKWSGVTLLWEDGGGRGRRCGIISYRNRYKYTGLTYFEAIWPIPIWITCRNLFLSLFSNMYYH